TYGVRVCSCATLATEPCRPMACIPLAQPPAVPCPLTPVPWTFTFSAKEKDQETGFSYFGSRYYSSDLSIWLSVDPMSGKYPSQSNYVYCGNNPIMVVDPNGEDWYESEDGKTLEFIYGESAQREGYTNIGSRLTQEYKNRIKNGEYSTVSMSANFGDGDFVAQKDGRCCEAANQMCINRGGERTFYGNELPLVTPGDNGKAGSSGIPKSFSYGIEKLCSSLENGIPVVAGVDYRPGSSNSITEGGDGMTDHYVAIIGVTLNFSKDNSTGKTFISGGNLRYANPGNNSSSDGLNPNNLFIINVSRNYRVERHVRYGVCFTMTNLRVR
ncbi:MAG: RHS repeat-associated core domain-containing protein, partial [Bacteroidales bacterium]|nr:RHS repeat-associated core domain-containing protein [Bacteroidales bacterium]